MADNSRCEARKKGDNIALIISLVLIFGLVVSCAIVKYMQEKRKKEDIEAIRIKGISDAANESPAPFV